MSSNEEEIRRAARRKRILEGAGNRMSFVMGENKEFSGDRVSRLRPEAEEFSSLLRNAQQKEDLNAVTESILAERSEAMTRRRRAIAKKYEEQKSVQETEDSNTNKEHEKQEGNEKGTATSIKTSTKEKNMMEQTTTTLGGRTAKILLKGITVLPFCLAALFLSCMADVSNVRRETLLSNITSKGTEGHLSGGLFMENVKHHNAKVQEKLGIVASSDSVGLLTQQIAQYPFIFIVLLLLMATSMITSLYRSGMISGPFDQHDNSQDKGYLLRAIGMMGQQGARLETILSRLQVVYNSFVIFIFVFYVSLAVRSVVN